MQPTIEAMQEELEAAWEEMEALQDEIINDKAQEEIEKAREEALAAQQAALAAQKAAQEALAASATSKFQLSAQEVIMKRNAAILDRLKEMYNYDGTSNYTINEDQYDDLNKKLRKGEALSDLEKLQMAVFELNAKTNELMEQAVEKFQTTAGADTASLKEMFDSIGRQMFRDEDGKTVYKGTDENGKTAYVYEDGTVYEGDEKDLTAIMGVPVVEDKGEVYTDANGNKVYKTTDENGNDVYTNANGSEYTGDVSELTQELNEYQDSDTLLAEINREFDRMDSEMTAAENERVEGETTETPATTETKAIDTAKRDAEAAELELVPGDREGTYTKESPFGTFLYVWDPNSETFKEFTTGEAGDTDADFTTSGEIIDKSNESAVEADAMIAMQEAGLNVVAGDAYPFEAEKDGVYYEYNRETGKFEPKKEAEQA